MKRPSARKTAPKGTPENPVRLNAPEFKTEAEEAAWWDENSDKVTDLLIKFGRRSPVKTQSITMRLPVQDIERARGIADKRGIGYQTLIKSLLHDALKRAAS
jgi:predicted DNA binding CopG/RHH family protein